jgi:hypothetical protein
VFKIVRFVFIVLSQENVKTSLPQFLQEYPAVQNIMGGGGILLTRIEVRNEISYDHAIPTSVVN